MQQSPYETYNTWNKDLRYSLLLWWWRQLFALRVLPWLQRNQWVRPNMRVLDIGAGRGDTLHLLHRRSLLDLKNSVGLEPSTGMVQLAAQRYPHIAKIIECQTATHVDQLHETFDMGIMCMVAHHLTDTELGQVFATLYHRVQGTLVLTNQSQPEESNEFMEKFIEGYEWVAHRGRTAPTHYRSAAQLALIAQQHGWQLADTHTIVGWYRAFAFVRA